MPSLPSCLSVCMIGLIAWTACRELMRGSFMAKALDVVKSHESVEQSISITEPKRYYPVVAADDYDEDGNNTASTTKSRNGTEASKRVQTPPMASAPQSNLTTSNTLSVPISSVSDPVFDPKLTAPPMAAAPQSNLTNSSTLSVPLSNASDPVFDPKLTAEDYLKLPPRRPTRQWLEDCANALAKDKNVVRPFPIKIPDYALGDCIKECMKCNFGMPSQKQKPYKAFRWRSFPDYNLTIAGYYNNFACNTMDRRNFTLVHEILEKHFADRPGFVKPDPEAIVIHLRLGDVVENSRQSTPTLLIEGGVGRHPGTKKSQMKTIQSVYYYLDQLQAYPQNHTVIMVGGSHMPSAYKRSRVYATCLQRGLALAGRRVEMNMDGGDADKDFFFNSYAKKYMLSTGGYSRTMGKLAVMHGGEIIGDRLDFDSKK